MTLIQRCIVIGGVLALLASGLLLPYTLESTTFLDPEDHPDAHYTSGSFGGYYSILSPPQGKNIRTSIGQGVKVSSAFNIDSNRLILEWLFIILVTGGLVIVAKTKAKRE